MTNIRKLNMSSVTMISVTLTFWFAIMANHLSIYSANAWTTDILPKLKLKFEQEKRLIYFGNQSDYFRILDQDDSSILIGARNAMYNISLKTLLENQVQRLEWKSSDAHRQLCTLKGKQETDCQNYIRVYSRLDDHTINVCGTNSFKPLCRTYKIGADGIDTNGVSIDNDTIRNDSQKMSTDASDDALLSTINGSEMPPVQSDEPINGNFYKILNEIDGQGRCPYNPTHNSSYIFTDGQLYSATVADFSGGDALIYRGSQRTEQYNAKQLNQPAFVSTVERNGYVFFFFREIALENSNCGKTVYSRVGRVCKNDRGGPSPSTKLWTSYLKTRLNCSIPGDFPFYFDEIQGTTGIVDGLYQAALNQRNLRNYHTADRIDESDLKQKQRSIIYAVFTTPQNAIPGSAVCAFQIDDIIRTFEGDFKGQKDPTSNWLPIPSSEIPKPRPGECVDNSRDLPMRTVNFVKMHTLMDDSVQSLYGRPLLTRVNYRFTAITVDPQIESLNGERYDVVFVGTDTGKVIKFINFVRTQANENNTQNVNDEQLETIVITETQALPIGYPVREMTIAKDQQSLIVVGNGHIVSIKLNHCSHIFRCRDCINLQDPYCVWDTKNRECVSTTIVTGHTKNNFLQHLRQLRKDSAKTVELCKSFGDDTDNYIEPSPVQPQGKSLSIGSGNGQSAHRNGSKGNNDKELSQNNTPSTRGTVASIGRVAPDLTGQTKSNDNNEEGNDIRVTSVDGFELTNQISSVDIEESGELGIVVPRTLGSDAMAAANNANGGQVTFMAHPMFASLIFIVFAVGLAIGFVLSKRFKWSHSPFDILRSGSSSSSTAHHHLNEHHRNQLNYYDKTTRGIPAGGPRNSTTNGTNGKDINLLMNVMGPYIAAGGGNNGRTSLTGQTPNNLNKKDILELDFETKDRSHECKNSTEHLDINDLKTNANNNTNTNCNNAPTAVIVNSTNTGTLQKVKKTYL